MDNEKDTFTPGDTANERIIKEILSRHGIETAQQEPVCTCSELQKHRMICPVCDKEEHDSWRREIAEIKFGLGITTPVPYYPEQLSVLEAADRMLADHEIKLSNGVCTCKDEPDEVCPVCDKEKFQKWGEYLEKLKSLKSPTAT